jgi:integrase
LGKYFRATLNKRSGKKNYYAFVTVPKNLRPLLKGQRQIYKSTQTNDYEEARDKLRDLEAELYLKLDHAELANHPLSKAYDALWEGLDGLGFWQETCDSNKQKTLIEKWARENPFSYMMLFENEQRWELYDEIRSMAGYVMATPSPGMSDPAESIAIATVQGEIEPLLQDFDLEFRKVSEVKYAPKKRSKPFSDAAKEWFDSSLFQNNKKTNVPKREKTKQEQITKVQNFMDWAGNVSLDDFKKSLATQFAEELSSVDSSIISGGAANETIHKYFTAVRSVLDWAVRMDYIHTNPWAGFNLGGYGRASQKYRDFTENELRQLFTMDMPKQDRLVLAILACTGARLDEIALLRWDQVHEDNTKDKQPLHWLSTTQAIVKNEASKRLVPLVPQVWKLIQAHRVYANPKEPQRLFSYSKDKDGKAENKASRAIMPHIRKISLDGTLTIHSLRHTFNTMCRNAGVEWELREFIQGRSGQGEGAKYGRPAWVEKQLEEIGKIDYSFLNGNLSISSPT